jgi:hypothetical protein
MLSYLKIKTPNRQYQDGSELAINQTVIGNELAINQRENGC